MAVSHDEPEAPSLAAGARPASDRRPFRPDIDGLRAVAILLVVAYHVDLPGVDGGFIGVDVFFVISGYLITRNLVVESASSGRVALVSFWGRRIRRLVPAMALMIGATIVASALIIPEIDFSAIARQGGAAGLYVSNIYFARELSDYFGGNVRSSPFLHTWSLGVEEQFYLLWPVVVGLVVALVRNRRRWLRPALGTVFGIVLVGSFGLSLRLTADGDPWAFYGLPSRAWEFAAAGLVALATVPAIFERPLVRAASALGGLAVIAATALTLTNLTRYPGAWALLPVVGTIAVILAGSAGAERPVLAVRGLGSRPARWLGRVSYSWYLWHWPFIILMVALFGGSLTIKLLAAAIALAVSTLGHHLVENPVRFAPGLVRSLPRTFVMGAACTVSVLVICVASVPLAEGRATADDRIVARALADRGDEVCTSRAPSPSGIELCIAGDIEADRTIVVLGDSHARHWSTALDEVGRREHIRIVGRWLPACPPLPILITEDVSAANVERCRAFREESLRLLDELEPDGVVISNAVFYDGRFVADDGSPVSHADEAGLWGERFRMLLEQLDGRGIPFGVIRDNPMLPIDAPVCVATADDVSTCNPPRDETLAQGQEIRDAETAIIAEFGDVPTMSTTDAICDATRCNVFDDDHTYLRYYDGGHLTKAFTASQEGPLGDLLLAVIAEHRP